MNTQVRYWVIRGAWAAAVAVVVLAWLVYFHNDVVAGGLPKWAWMQSAVKKVGQPQDGGGSE